MTVTVTIKTQFEAAVHLYGYDGACGNTHGHTYQVEVTFGNHDATCDMVVDYYIARTWVNQIIQSLDHQYLNKLEAFSTISPTTENIARWLNKQISDIINDENVYIKRISLAENNHFSVQYESDT